MRAYNKIAHKFSVLKDSGILIYFPHGFGDWVHMSHILPLLEPSNRYFISGFGDDFVSVMDGCGAATPLYLGTASWQCSCGELFGNRHFGVDVGELHGTEVEANLPLSLYCASVENSITEFLFTPFVDPVGFRPFPHHTKGRALLRSILLPGLPRYDRLLSKLPCPINFDVPPMIQQFVENRLVNFLGVGRKSCACSAEAGTLLKRRLGGAGGGTTRPVAFWLKAKSAGTL